MTSPSQHGPLKLLVGSDGLVVLQPSPAGASPARVETLSIVTSSGRVEVSSAPPLSVSAKDALALIGVFKLKAGAAVALVTGAQQVAVLFGRPVFRVSASRLIKPKAKLDAGDRRLLSYLEDAIDPVGSGRNLFFSYGADLTLTAQRRSEVLGSSDKAALTPPRRADTQFFWNRTLAAPVMAAGGDAFVPTMIVGSVGQLQGLSATTKDGVALTFDVTLIARRSADRSGTRHWRRGADATGAAANFVETEQLVTASLGGAPPSLSSFVQVRGSIPLLWTQLPNIKYKPPTKLLEGSASAAAFDAHMDALIAKYKAVSCINLVNQHGSEGKLEGEFRAQAARYSGSGKAKGVLRYTAFDFHKECGATRYDRLSKLWQQLLPDFEAAGLYLTGPDGQLASSQGGVFRTNCVDCLDRTNVLQGVLGRKALEEVLRRLGGLAPGATLDASLPAVEARFKILWADHGDDISRQYAGTGALKSGFTRTGKRGLGGLVDDGVKSMARYYLNNFQDGHKQDALDLISGAYSIKPGVALRFRRQHSPTLLLLTAAGALGYGLTQLTAALNGQLEVSAQALAVQVAAPILASGALLATVVANGRQLVDRPQLCPQLADTVGVAGGGKA